MHYFRSEKKIVKFMVTSLSNVTFLFMENLIKLFMCKIRASCSLMFFKIAVQKKFAIFRGKHLGWSLFLIKLQSFRPVTLLKRDSNTGVFP